MLCFPTALSSGSKFIQWIALSTFWIACEPQTYFRSSPLSLRRKRLLPAHYLFNNWSEIGLWSRTLSALTDPAHKIVANLTLYLSHRHKKKLPRLTKTCVSCSRKRAFCVSQTSVKQMWQGFFSSRAPSRGGLVLPYKRLMGMCRWMGSHFHDWIGYDGVAFSINY